MNRIAKNTDLSPLKGRAVQSVSLTRFQVIIRLEDDLFVSIEGECSFAGDPSSARSKDYVVLANKFASLLGYSIETVKIVGDDTVILKFSNGMSLSIFDSNERYESFQIQLPGKLVVV